LIAVLIAGVLFFPTSGFPDFLFLSVSVLVVIGVYLRRRRR
jgi:hypothetical protein